MQPWHCCFNNHLTKLINIHILYIKATVVVFVHPSVCLAGQGQGRAGSAGVVVSVRLSVLQGRGRAARHFQLR